MNQPSYRRLRRLRRTVVQHQPIRLVGRAAALHREIEELRGPFKAAVGTGEQVIRIDALRAEIDRQPSRAAADEGADQPVRPYLAVDAERAAPGGVGGAQGGRRFVLGALTAETVGPHRDRRGVAPAGSARSLGETTGIAAVRCVSHRHHRSVRRGRHAIETALHQRRHAAGEIHQRTVGQRQRGRIERGDRGSGRNRRIAVVAAGEAGVEDAGEIDEGRQRH